MDCAGSSKGRVIKRQLSSGNLLEGLPLPKELKKLIECPVCEDRPLPPIYNCQTGHAICSKCKDQTKECPICKTPYTASRNFLMESIVQNCKYYCIHRDKGCNVTGNSEIIKDHLKNCTFRPVKCYLSGFGGCKGEVIFLSYYVAHLTDAHKMGRMSPIAGKTNVFLRAYSLGNYDKVNWNEKTYDRWEHAWLSFDEKVFVNRSFRRGTKFFFQLAIIAESFGEDKYAVKVTISNNKFLKYELTSLVPSIREFRDNGKSVGEGEYEAVSKDLIEKLGQRVEVEEESEYKLTWDVRYELTKIVNPARQ